MAVRNFGFLDVSQCMSRFVSTYREKLKDDANYPGAQTIMLRTANADCAILKEWKSARDVLQRLRNAAAPHTGGRPATLGKCMIVSLRPGAYTDWERCEDEYSLAHLRLHICLVPSPMAFLYSGGEVMNPPVGQVTLFDQQALHSEVNLGPVARVHLIADVRRPTED